MLVLQKINLKHCRGKLTKRKLAQEFMGETDEKDPLNQVVEYRVFDLRNRFPDPVPTLHQALECLLSDQAYLPESTGEIVACLRDGRSIEIPQEFFIVMKPPFQTREAAQAWVRERMADIDAGNSMAKLRGALLANPDDPIEKQVEDAFSRRFPRLIERESIDAACDQALAWLRHSIQAMG